MKKAIVIGGNQGGLNAARCLGEIGFEVVVYEKQRREDVAYDWTDDIDPAVFENIGVPMPPKETYFKKKVWTFVNPAETVKITVAGSQENDISVYRRPLNDYFYALLDGKAEVNYQTEVEKLILDGTSVKGVVIDGREEYCDLVVDCSGLFSPFRASLPQECKITKSPAKEEFFVAYRGFFRANTGVEPPQQTNKAYLKHVARKGISWCIYDHGLVDILIGTVGELPDEDVTNALEALKKDNPILSDELVKAGFKTAIPVRYPISRMVANGYVLCGDSAFTTIPMMGSGVVCSLDAGKFLQEVLKDNDACTIENLWNYQVKFFQKYASFCGVDMLKRWLLATDAKDIDFLFESGVIDEAILAGGAGGETMKLSVGQMLKKAWQGRKRLKVLLQIASVMGKSDKATALANEIPTVFNEAAVTDWQTRLDALYASK